MVTRLPHVDLRALEQDLRSEVDGEVRFDAGSLATYSTDGSNYRQIPIAVVVPCHIEAGQAAVAVCRRHQAAVLSRGGGTSLAGQTTNAAVVIDWSKYCRALVSVDADSRTCVVEPGIVLDDLDRELARYGLQFGPKPSTHSQCTLGGMIGNNSCGASAQHYGKTVDNVRRLEILTYGGLRCWVGLTSEAELSTTDGQLGELYRHLLTVRDRYGERIRHAFPDIPRRVSGYNLDSLLCDGGIDVAKLLVGSEGTLVTVLHAELKLFPLVPRKATVAIGYPDIAAAADAVPAIVESSRDRRPLLVEALDGELVHFMREEGMFPDSVRALPEGESWLLVQYGGDTAEEADAGVAQALRALGKTSDDADGGCLIFCVSG